MSYVRGRLASLSFFCRSDAREREGVKIGGTEGGGFSGRRKNEGESE